MLFRLKVFKKNGSCELSLGWELVQKRNCPNICYDRAGMVQLMENMNQFFFFCSPISF